MNLFLIPSESEKKLEITSAPSLLATQKTATFKKIDTAWH